VTPVPNHRLVAERDTRRAEIGAPTQAIIVCPPGRSDPLRVLGGLTLIERQLRQLWAVGIHEVLIVAPPSFIMPSAPLTHPLRMQVLASRLDSPWKMIHEFRHRLAERFLLLRGDLVVDQRLIEWLCGQSEDTLISRAESGPPELFGILDSLAVEELVEGTQKTLQQKPLGTFPTYWRERRGHVPLLLARVESSDDAEVAWNALIDHVDKRTKDLPALLFDPPFENFLTRRLAPTRITPNQVTAATTLLGFFVAWLFWNGWLFAGVLLAITVEVLDGVDGKLARLKWQTSKVGELEHVLDFFYEMSWYVGLGRHFAVSGVGLAWPCAVAICSADFLDQMAYLFFARRGGGNLDEGSALMRRFRVIGGRRNIYAWMMLPGILLGIAATAFTAVAIWAVTTAVVHWFFAVTLPAEAHGNSPP